MTGCGFAASLASRGGGQSLAFSLFEDLTAATAENLDRAFDLAASGPVPAIAVFPGVRVEADIVQLLRRLVRGARWTVTVESPDGLATDDALIGLQWRTPDGLTSLPMGLAPFATMPVTRRAPHTCIAAWPGGHENPRRTKFEPGTVDFLDTRIDPATFPGARYKDLVARSQKDTKHLLSSPPDDANFYRRVAFRLSPAVRAEVEGLAR